MRKIRRAKKIKRTLKRALRKTENRAGIKKITKRKTSKEILGMPEMRAQISKFYQPTTIKAPESTQVIESVQAMKVSGPAVLGQDLPAKYDTDRLVLQLRDPWWIHAYWEVKEDTLNKLKNELKDEFHKAQRILRVYDVSRIIFNGRNAHHFFDIQFNEYANNWYIDVGGPGRSWCTDYGLLLSNGKFITILRSNIIDTPLDGPSWITDEEWMIPEDMFARLYGMGFGLGRSSPVGKAWQERIKRQLYSGAFVSSVASPIKKMPVEKKFWLVVNTELIVYGATEPDAKVLVQGKPIKLRQDGTFSLRFALPDGKQVIPVKAKSCDGREERAVTPIVTRETK